MAEPDQWLPTVGWRLHVTNVAVHAMASGLLTAVLYLSIFRRVWEGMGNKDSALVAALAGGMLFAVHPVHVEGVASIVGRADSLACCVVLLALLLVEVAASKRVSRGVSAIASVTVALLLIAAVFFKETGIVGFALVPLVLLLTHTPGDSWPSLWTKKRKLCPILKRNLLICAVVVALTFIVVLLRLLATGGDVNVNMQDYYNRLRELGTLMRLVNVPYLFLLNLDRMFVPTWLAYDYSELLIIKPDSSTSDIQSMLLPILPALIGVVALIAAIVMAPVPRLPGSRLLLLLGGWLSAALLPSSQLVFPVGFLLAERVLYTASAAVCALAGAAFAVYSARKQTRWISIVLLATALALLAGHTISRSQDWKSEDDLFKAQLEVFPMHEMSLHGLGWNAFQKRNFEEAKKHFQHPGLDHHADSAWMLGRIAYLENDVDAAARYFEKAVVILPSHKANNELGMMLWVRGDQQGAYTHILRSLYAALPHSAPERRSILNNAGCMLLLVDKDPKTALDYFLKAFAILGDAVYLQNTVYAHAALGNYSAAVTALSQLQAAGLNSDEPSKLLMRMLQEYVAQPSRKWDVEPHCHLQFLEY